MSKNRKAVINFEIDRDHTDADVVDLSITTDLITSLHTVGADVFNEWTVFFDTFYTKSTAMWDARITLAMLQEGVGDTPIAIPDSAIPDSLLTSIAVPAIHVAKRVMDLYTQAQSLGLTISSGCDGTHEFCTLTRYINLCRIQHSAEELISVEDHTTEDLSRILTLTLVKEADLFLLNRI